MSFCDLVFFWVWKCMNWLVCVWINANHESQHLTTMTLSAYRRATVATLVSIVTLISASPVDVWSITSLSTDPFLIKCHWLNLTSPPVSLYFPISHSHNKHTYTQSKKKVKIMNVSTWMEKSYPIVMKIWKGTALNYFYTVYQKNLPKDLIGLLWTKSTV